MTTQELKLPMRRDAAALLRRCFVVPLAIAGVLAVLVPSGASGQGASTAAAAAPLPLPPELRAIMDNPKYRDSRWGIYVADAASGKVLYDLRGGERFLPASTTKLFPAGAALDAYGPDYRFETPVYRTGPVGPGGHLRGDLVLVASGDLTMGGRDTPDGRIDFTPIDHINANAAPVATLTPENPLAGLNALARQVAAAGIRRVSGDVIIDDRLFPSMQKDGYSLTPIWINDNLIDLVIKPRSVGQPATFTWRPQTAAYQVRSRVRTVAAGEPLEVSVTSPQPGQILLQGQIPVTQTQLVRTYQVEDPPAFARTLLLEALQRQGVTVQADPTGPNPAGKLPPPRSYRAAQRVALHRSLPFSENLKLILKTSHNQHADMLIFLLALKQGKTSFEEGMQAILPFVTKAGLDPSSVWLGDGRGNADTDLFSPRVATQLLRYMATRPDFAVYSGALPILGVDGTEVDTVGPTSPVKGKAAAKSGTTGAGELLHDAPVLMTRGLAGYMTARSGRRLVFAVYVNYVPIAQVLDLLVVAREQGTMIEAIYNRH